MWWVGDWWKAGHRYGDRKAVVEAEDWEGPPYETCAKAGYVSKLFEPERRRANLSWQYHLAVAGDFPSDEADRVLDWCEEVLGRTKRPPTIKALRERWSPTIGPRARGPAAQKGEDIIFPSGRPWSAGCHPGHPRSDRSSRRSVWARAWRGTTS
jgi:hypothetical protein